MENTIESCSEIENSLSFTKEGFFEKFFIWKIVDLMKVKKKLISNE
jgi:hypothetical protein